MSTNKNIKQFKRNNKVLPLKSNDEDNSKLKVKTMRKREDSNIHAKPPKKRQDDDHQASNAEEKWARIKFQNHDEFSAIYGTSKKYIKSFKMNASTKLRKLNPFHYFINKVEREYGPKYSSFFDFIVSLFFLNLFVCVLTVIFIIVPQMVFKEHDSPSLFNTTSEQINSQTCSEQIFNNSVQNITNNFNYQYLLTKCCSYDYKKYIDDLVQSRTTSQSFLDLLQGTGFMENTFLFYGYYSNRTIGTSEDHDSHANYYMGVAFVFITLIALLVSAILLLFRLGEGFKNSIKKRIDSKSCTASLLVFSSWNFRIQDSNSAKKQKNMILQEIRMEWNSIKKNEEREKSYNNLTTSKKFQFYTIRTVVIVLTSLLYPAAGLGIHFLNKFCTQELRKENIEYALKLVYEYLPAIGIKILNMFFICLCSFIMTKNFENYGIHTAQTIYLLRTGSVRLIALIFLFISIITNIFSSKGTCTKQSSDSLLNIVLENQTEFSVNPDEIKCWETFIGQQLYKIVVLDFVSLIIWTFVIEFPKSKINCKKYQGKAEFDLQMKFLDILFVQTVFWSSYFFSPFSSIFATVYFCLLFFFRLFNLKYTSTTTSENELQAKSNIAFYVVLFVAFIFVLGTMGLIFTMISPSRSCGPFSLHDIESFYIFSKLRKGINDHSPKVIETILNLIFSYVFMGAVMCILLILTWLFYKYAKANIEIAKTFKKIVDDETKKNNLLKQDIENSKKLHVPK